MLSSEALDQDCGFVPMEAADEPHSDDANDGGASAEDDGTGASAIASSDSAPTARAARRAENFGPWSVSQVHSQKSGQFIGYAEDFGFMQIMLCHTLPRAIGSMHCARLSGRRTP